MTVSIDLSSKPDRYLITSRFASISFDLSVCFSSLLAVISVT